MYSLKRIVIIFSTIFLTAGSLLAAGDGGSSGPGGTGGGKAFVCRDANQNIKSVQLLDLWEIQNLDHPRNLVHDNLSLEQKVQNALLTIANGLGTNGFSDRKSRLKELTDESEIFLKPNEMVVPRKGLDLTPTPDSYEIAKPRKCNQNSVKGQIEQVVRYDDRTSKIWIDADIVSAMDRFDKTDKINHAALIVHEVLYAYLRKIWSDSDSIRVRRTVGYVFSGGSFDPFNSLIKSSQVIRCTGEHLGSKYVATDIWFFRDEDKNQYRTILGSSLGQIAIGLTSRPVQSGQLDNEPGTVLFNEFFSQTHCSNHGVPTSKDGPIFIGGSEIDQSTPVDFDRKVRLTLSCEEGNPTLYISTYNPQVVNESPHQPEDQKLGCGIFSSDSFKDF